MSLATGCSAYQPWCYFLSLCSNKTEYLRASGCSIEGLRLGIVPHTSTTQRDQIIASSACFSTRISRDMYLLSKTINCPLDTVSTREKVRFKEE